MDNKFEQAHSVRLDRSGDNSHRVTRVPSGRHYNLLRRMSLLMARFGRFRMSAIWSLLGANRTSRRSQNEADDPERILPGLMDSPVSRKLPNI
jgi:hypothetical protein